MLWSSPTWMHRRPLFFVAAAALVLWALGSVINHRPFPPDTTPGGAYARIALCVAEQRAKDMFPYLETEAQWAAYTIRDQRKKAYDRVRESYPPDAGDRLIDAWKEEASAPDGADVWALLAIHRGWTARLERDMSGAADVAIQGERATVVTAHGTRYAFRRRDNGIWGLTMFTPELQAEAERASRDLQVVSRSAADYDRARTQ